MHVYEQVILHPLECLMGLLLQSEYQISSGKVWHLLSFPLHHNIVSVGHASLDVNGYFSVVMHQSSTSAVFALGCHRAAFASTFVAVCLHLNLHSESNLYVLHDNTLTLAPRAGLQLAILGASSRTRFAIDVSVDV